MKRIYQELIARHLSQFRQIWNDCGFGEYGLYYLRTKDKMEVDFLVTKNEKPWFLVEVKTKAQGISSALHHFHKQTGALHAFQVAFDLPFVNKNCFAEYEPILVSARTFLSQLI